METKKYVLYADDDTDDRDMIEDIFLDYPEHILLTFSNGQLLLTYLDQIKKESICLIVLDVNMPQMNGMETLKAIRNDSQFADLPIIMFTTSSSLLDRIEAERFKAKVIIKPVSYNQIKKVSADMMEFCSSYLSK